MATQSTRTFSLTLPSTHEALKRAVDGVRAFLETQGVGDELAYDALLLASEAITNAMGHGNRWEASKSVTVTVSVGAGTIELSTEDEGSGFDVSRTPTPLEDDAITKAGGRGLFLMRHLAQEVHFEDGGRRLRLTLRSTSGTP